MRLASASMLGLGAFWTGCAMEGVDLSVFWHPSAALIVLLPVIIVVVGNKGIKPHNTRAIEVAANFLKDCDAEFLSSDAYSGYGRCTKGTDIKNAYCFAHSRRKWVDAESNYPQATPVIEWIGELYGIEREIKSLSPGERLVNRQSRSKPIIEKIRNYLFELDVLPMSSIGKARKYMLNFWDGLTLFLSDGRLAIANNLAERQLRGPVLGRKNFLGNHSIRGANTTTILYSIIESCKLNNVEPYRYLRETLRAILSDQAYYTPSKYRENFLV